MSLNTEPERRFLNHYKHCTEWTDIWSCMCDDQCPVCGVDVSPHESEELD
jgi:hypothetical protein